MKKNFVFCFVLLKNCLTFASAKPIGLWCNGNTADSGPAFPGSSPGSPTRWMSWCMNIGSFVFFCVFLRDGMLCQFLSSRNGRWGADVVWEIIMVGSTRCCPPLLWIVVPIIPRLRRLRRVRLHLSPSTLIRGVWSFLSRY